MRALLPLLLLAACEAPPAPYGTLSLAQTVGLEHGVTADLRITLADGEVLTRSGLLLSEEHFIPLPPGLVHVELGIFDAEEACAYHGEVQALEILSHERTSASIPVYPAGTIVFVGEPPPERVALRYEGRPGKRPAALGWTPEQGPERCAPAGTYAVEVEGQAAAPVTVVARQAVNYGGHLEGELDLGPEAGETGVPEEVGVPDDAGVPEEHDSECEPEGQSLGLSPRGSLSLRGVGEAHLGQETVPGADDRAYRDVHVAADGQVWVAAELGLVARTGERSYVDVQGNHPPGHTVRQCGERVFLGANSLHAHDICGEEISTPVLRLITQLECLGANGAVAATDQGAVWRSDDGLQWAEVRAETGSQITALAVDGEDIFVADLDGNVAVSVEGGEFVSNRPFPAGQWVVAATVAPTGEDDTELVLGTADAGGAVQAVWTCATLACQAPLVVDGDPPPGLGVTPGNEWTRAAIHFDGITLLGLGDHVYVSTPSGLRPYQLIGAQENAEVVGLGMGEGLFYVLTGDQLFSGDIDDLRGLGQ